MARLIGLGLLLAAACGPALAQFGKNKITYGHFDWRVYKSPHFDIHYYPEMEPFLEEIVSYAESAYLKVSKDLDHELRFRVPLITYKTHGEFQQTNIVLSELPEAVAAFAEPVQNRMVLPIDLPPDKLYQLISHELVHIFQYSMFFEGYLGRALRSNPPTWLVEGMASYLAQDEDNMDRMVIRDAVVNNVLPPIQELDVLSFLTYRYGHAIFDYIEQEHGKEGLRTFLFEYRKVLLTNNLEKAIKEAFGYDIDEFNRRFNRYLRRKYFPVLLEKKSPDDYGKEIGVKKPGVFTFSPTISPSGELIGVLSSPKLELDLMVLSAEDGKVIKNLTKGWTNHYRNLVAEAFAGKRDLSWSSVADRIAVFGRREDKWPLLIFNALTGKLEQEVTFEEIVECSSPAFSADGRRVAFEGNQNGVVDIFEIDLETRQIANLTRDDFFDANPWFAPDGRTLLYNRRIGSYWKVFSVDLSDPSKKTQLTSGAYSDLQPSYARDGKKIYFSSDRGPYGIFNIHSLDLASGDIVQYTDVVGGCFAPVELAERDGEGYLAYAAYYEGTFRLYRMPLKPESTIPVAETLAEPVEAEPFEPPLSLRVDESAKSPYKLRWDIEAPSIGVGVADDGTFLSNASLQFSDLLGNHRFLIDAYTVSDFSNYSGTYVNLKHRFNWGASLFDFRDFFLRASSSGIARDQIDRATGANVFIEYPFNRYYRVQSGVGVLDRSQDLLVGFDPQTGILDFDTFGDTFLTLSTSFVGDTTRFQGFGPFQGKRINIGALYAPHLSGDLEGDFNEYRFDFRAYRQATRRSLVAWRLASIYNVGDRQNTYGFGGLNQLRGFGFRDYIGNNLAWTNLEFRYPLIDELRFPVLRLGQIRGLFFFDAGAAWLEDNLWYDPDQRTIDPLGFAARGGIRFDPATGQPIEFRFWDSENNRLQDGRASYGAGFQFIFIGGLQFNWVWSKRLEYTQFCSAAVTDACVIDPLFGGPIEKRKADPGGTRMDFYITYDF